jgi:hypothetical protein
MRPRQQVPRQNQHQQKEPKMLSIVGTPQQVVIGGSLDSLLPGNQGQEVRAAIMKQIPEDEEEDNGK